MESLSVQIMSFQANLTEVIVPLNDNDLTELQDGLFDGLRALTHL